MGGTPSKQKGRTSSKQSQLETADRPTPPGKPQLVPGTPSSEPDVVTISWEPSQYDGGSKITGYLVEHRRTGSPHWVRASPVLVRVSQLTLSGLEPGWRYQFRVCAKNAVGYSEPGELSELLTVTLQRSAASAPHFVKELLDSVALENEKAELSVQVKGTPPPTVAWYKDGLEIYSSRRQKILTENDTSTLLIYQAALTDEGEIKCTATNRVGHAVTKARLRLEAPPSIRLPRQYEEGLIFEKDEVIRLRVAIVGRPPPEVSWVHNGEVLPHGGRYEIGHSERYASLRVGEAKRSDRGEYQVRAVNKLGEDVAAFLVTVTDRPMPPGKARVAMTLGRSVTLSWTTPDDDGGCKIGNFIVEYYRIGWNMWLKAATCRQLTTTLGDLIEGSEYKFRVKAENPYGVSDPSEESDVVFIPDPKRGLLEPPERNGMSLDSVHAIEQWLEERKRPLETTSSPTHDDLHSVRKNKKKRGVVSIPTDEVQQKSPLVQIVAKDPVKPAFKSIHSEDSMSPTVTPEPEYPAVPKRKVKGDKKIVLPEGKDIKVPPERKKKISVKLLEEEKTVGIVAKEKWEDQIPRDEDNILHGSSEMMLVLLPNSRAATEERDYLRKNDFLTSLEDSEAIAPPMSLSAPELGSGEAPEFPPIRPAISSSELLHERTMSRFYQDIAEEESQSALKRRTSIERRRSFERRSSSKGKDFIFPISKVKSSEEIRMSFNKNENKKDIISSKTQDLPIGGNKSEYDSSKIMRRPLWASMSSSKDSMDSVQEYSKRGKFAPQSSEEDMEYEDESLEEEEENFEEEGELTEAEAEEMLDEEMKEEEEEDEELEDEYDEDEDEDEFDSYHIMTESEEDIRQSEPFQEDTYHPRSMIPKISTVQDTRLISNIVKNSKQDEQDNYRLPVKNNIQRPPVPAHKSPVMGKKEAMNLLPEKEDTTKNKLNINSKISTSSSKKSSSNDEPKSNDNFYLENNKNFKNERGRLSVRKPDIRISLSSPVLTPDGRQTPSPNPIMPKPILKNRDHSQERPLEPVSKKNKHQAPIAAVEPELNIISKANSDNTLNNNASPYGNGVKLRKKTVRIEEPEGRVTKSNENIENEMGISAAEVARNRRRRSGSLGEDADPLKIVISHYSDIVAEFGKTKRVPAPKCLNLEELRAAAQKIESPTSDLESQPNHGKERSEEEGLPLSESLGSTASSQTEIVSEISEPEQSSVRESPEKPIPVITFRHYTVTERKIRSFFDFVMDLALFLVACWLYAFKDERLAIPIILLLIYRQAFDAIQKRLPSRWRRK